jgi:hypothetical protein
MNYSFIDKYKSSDFTNKTELYGNSNSEKNDESKQYFYPQGKNSISNDSENRTKNNWATDGSIQKTMLQSVYTPTPLGEIYFSIDNIKRIQQMIKYAVFTRTSGKYLLKADQNETDLLVVMRDIYINDAVNSPYRLVHQVKILNHKTIEKIVPDMITLIKQDEDYVNQLNKPINPIALPVNVNRKGRLSLPSVTKIFNS